MDVVRLAGEMQTWAETRRLAGRRIGLVPTMGSLHEGHLSLVRTARMNGCDAVAATIFVNPTQFGPGEDYEKYPRDEERDLRMLEQVGVDAVFAPPVEEVYPPGFQTYIEVGEVSQGLCGATRPGHFRGVATVVARLFLVCRPHVAVFGEKDYQQLAVIRRMVADLGFGIEIVGAPIIREPDGLAMSSRNAYLKGEDRRAALCLSEGLIKARDLFRAGERDPAKLCAVVRERIEEELHVRFEYAEARDPETLAPLSGTAERMTLLTAARVGPARLIDNITLWGGDAA